MPRWMRLYWIGLAALFLASLGYYWYFSLFPFHVCCHPWQVHRNEILDMISFAIAAIAYPFFLNAIFRRKAS